MVLTLIINITNYNKWYYTTLAKVDAITYAIASITTIDTRRNN